MLFKYHLQFVRRLQNHSRRNFFTSNLEKKIANGGRCRMLPHFGRRSTPHADTPADALAPLALAAAPSALATSVRWSNQSAAALHASLRTRPIIAARSVTEIAPRASSTLNRWEHFRQKSYAWSTGNRRFTSPFAFAYRSRSRTASASATSNCFRVALTSAYSKLY